MRKVGIIVVLLMIQGCVMVWAQLGDPQWGMSAAEIVRLEGRPSSRESWGDGVEALRYHAELGGWGADVLFLVGERGLYETRTEWMATSGRASGVAQTRLVRWVAKRMKSRESDAEGRRVATTVDGETVPGREWHIRDERVTFFFGDERTWDLIRRSTAHAPPAPRNREERHDG